MSVDSTNVLLFRNDDAPIDQETTNLEVQIVNPRLEVFTFWSELYSEYFADVEGIWEPTDRDDDNGNEVVTDGPEIEEPPVENPEVVEVEEDGDEPDSASTAVGYTFSIITLFALLNKFHLNQVMS